jgi:hypothetical protein
MRPLTLSVVLILALAGPALAKPAKARHHAYRRARHLVLEMKDIGRAAPVRATFARSSGDQPPTWRRRLGAKGAVATVGYNRGEAVKHPDELNGPGAARFDHADSTVGAGVKIPF